MTVTVGDETFTTTADVDGDYSVDIEIEAANADAFIVLSARGVGEQSFVEFTSLAGSFQSLADQVGDDGTLSSAENFATQITNVSTAEAVLLIEANGGAPLTSDAELQSLASEINAQDVLDLATTIKLAVDNAATYPLPEGQTSILELVSNATTRQTFINEVYEQDTSAFTAMQAAIVQDAGLARPIDIEGDYSFTTALLSTDAGFSFNYTGRVLHFDLLEDGTGGVSSETYDVPMTWTTAGSTIQVTYNNPVETVSYDTENCVGDGGVRQVEDRTSSFAEPGTRMRRSTTASGVRRTACCTTSAASSRWRWTARACTGLNSATMHHRASPIPPPPRIWCASTISSRWPVRRADRRSRALRGRAISRASCCEDESCAKRGSVLVRHA